MSVKNQFWNSLPPAINGGIGADLNSLSATVLEELGVEIKQALLVDLHRSLEWAQQKLHLAKLDGRNLHLGGDLRLTVIAIAVGRGSRQPSIKIALRTRSRDSKNSDQRQRRGCRPLAWPALVLLRFQRSSPVRALLLVSLQGLIVRCWNEARRLEESFSCPHSFVFPYRFVKDSSAMMPTIKSRNLYSFFLEAANRR